MQGMVAGKRSRGKPRQIREKDITYIRLVRWQQQAEWRRIGIKFAETSGQRRPDEDMLREKRREIGPIAKSGNTIEAYY